MFDLHRHDEYSTFDGFGKAKELAELCVEYGYKSLCTTNHGNTNGLIQTYQACKDLGLKAILGVEGYFLPKWKPQTRGFHLCLIAKDLKGYGNINRIQFEGEKQKYYNPIWDLSILEKYHEGLICTTACVASYTSQCILKDKPELAEKMLVELHKIFGDDLYIEIQPYVVSEPGMQEKVNLGMISLGEKLGIKMILTSDSHRGRKEDMPTYIKMHEIANHKLDEIEQTYSERYMPLPDEMRKRFFKMHRGDFGDDKAKRLAKEMYANLDEIEDKCEKDYLDKLELQLPKLGDGTQDTYKVLVKNVKEGLKTRGKYKQEYIERCKAELEVIKFHSFQDYFLIVADYVNWAKSNGIAVGPGRGSVCNCLVAYALRITEVDSLAFGLDFRRFLRKDKKSFPDIDLDFQTSRRHEVIEYLCTRYEGHAARICSYGLYKVDNLINDLAKCCGLVDYDQDGKLKPRASEIASIKALINKYLVDERLDEESFFDDPDVKKANKDYDNIMVHFAKLFKKVRYIGTHAAGVAITGGELLDYCALRLDKNGDIYTSYDLIDIEAINVIKFDILGLKTMESIHDLRESTGEVVDYEEIVKDPKLIKAFQTGNCDGVFQFEKQSVRGILSSISCDSFDDIVAASAMNRPGPLSLHMPEIYADNKMHPENAMGSLWWDVTKESHGTIIYQEQVQKICVELAGMEWGDADKIMKFMKGGNTTEKMLKLQEQYRNELLGKFSAGLQKLHNVPFEEAEKLFDDMTCYTFNKGHALGYSLISVEEMYYKIYHPNEYWFCKLKYAKSADEYSRFCCKAVCDGSVIFLPHVNYSKEWSRLRKVEGEPIIQQGLAEIKNVGEKAASAIVEERKKGVFISYDDFVDRCKSRTVTMRVINTLKEQGALEFNKKMYVSRVTKYNSSLMARASR